MNGEPSAENATLFPVRAGDQLREARVAQRLDIDEIAARTRVPQRHLEAIENSNYSALPSPTYAIGFAKAYARAVGADEVAIAAVLRGELAVNYERAVPREMYNTEDPARVPPRGIAWMGLAVAVLILIGVGLWYGTDWLRSTAPSAPTVAASQSVPVPQRAPVRPVGAGQVALIATDQVWLRVYDGAGKTLFEKTMNAGERYEVPDAADRPMINVGRPEFVQVTVNGANVAPLGRPGIAVKDVGVSVAALQARGSPATASSPTAATVRPAPAPSPTRAAAPPRDIPPAFREPAAPPVQSAPPAAEPTPAPGNGTA